jgi:hypothetical protein
MTITCWIGVTDVPRGVEEEVDVEVEEELVEEVEFEQPAMVRTKAAAAAERKSLRFMGDHPRKG